MIEWVHSLWRINMDFLALKKKKKKTLEGSRQSSMQWLDYNRNQVRHDDVHICPIIPNEHTLNHSVTERGPCSSQYEKEHRGFIPKVLTQHSVMTHLKQNHVQHSKPGLKNRRFYWRKVFLRSLTALSLYLLEESVPTGFLHGDSRLCEQQRHRLNKIHSCLQCLFYTTFYSYFLGEIRKWKHCFNPQCELKVKVLSGATWQNVRVSSLTIKTSL